MARRITESRIVKFLLGGGSAIVLIGLFSLLFSLGVVTLEGNYTANEYCGGDVVCYLEMTELCFNEDVFVYPMEAAKLINAEPTDLIDDIRMYRGWGDGWREIPLNITCTGTWCGGTGTYDAKYSYAFRKDRCYDIRIEVEKPVDSTVSWSINPEGEWLPLENESNDYVEGVSYLSTDAIRTCTDGVCNLIIGRPVAYLENNSYLPIDNTIIEYNQDGYDYAMEKAGYKAYFKDNSNYGDGVKYCVNGQCFIYQPSDYSYRDKWGSQDYIQSVGNVPATIYDTAWRYDGLFTDVDLLFELNANNMKEKYIINELPKTPATWLTEPVTLDFGGYIKYGDLDIYVNDTNMTGVDFVTKERIEFRNSTGATLFYLPAPYAYDANNSYNYNVSYEIKNQNNDIWFYLRTPYSWLQNASFPVTVDPTTVLNSTHTVVDFHAYDGLTYRNEIPVMNWNVSSLSTDLAEVTNVTLTFTFADYSGVAAHEELIFFAYDNSSWDDTITRNELNALTYSDAYTITVNSGSYDYSTAAKNTFDITTLFSDNYNGEEQFSFFIYTADSSGFDDFVTLTDSDYLRVGKSVGVVTWIDFYSSDYTTTSYAPILNITYDVFTNPTWSDNSSSGTEAGSEVDFSVKWNVSDGYTNMSHYVFGWHNGVNWSMIASSNDIEDSTQTIEGLSDVDKNFSMSAGEYSTSSSATTTVTFPTAFDDTNYAILSSPGSDTDHVYSVVYTNKLSTSVDLKTSDDFGNDELVTGPNNYLAWEHGYNTSVDGTFYYQCFSTTAASGPDTHTWSTTMPDTNYGAFCLSIIDSDDPTCIIDNTADDGKTTTAIKTYVTDDYGTDELTSGIDVCAFSYGSFNFSNKIIEIGEFYYTTNGLQTITLDTTMSSTTYSVITSHRLGEGTENDGTVCEVSGKTTTSFQVQCENDDDTITTNEYFDYIAVDSGSVINTGTSKSIEDTLGDITYSDIDIESYSSIDIINISIEITDYNKSGSTTAGNNDPDLQLYAYNGTSYELVDNFSITTTGIYNFSITDADILNAWSTSTNRDLFIQAINIDEGDSISWNYVNITLDSQQYFLNDSAVEFIPLDYCYQETANVSTECGGLDTGTYNLHINLRDGNDSTCHGVSGGYYYGYFNYTKPTDATSDSKLRIASEFATHNISIPSSCWSQSPLQFKVTSSDYIAGYGNWWDCWDGSDWLEMAAYSDEYYACEEAMWWSIPDTSSCNENGTLCWSNVTKTISSTVGHNISWYVWANTTGGSDFSNTTDTFSFLTTSSGAPDTNFSIWTGSAWTDVGGSDIIQFRCTPTQTDCEPTNQDVGSSQSIYQVCNNGTVSGTGVYMHLNETFTNIDMKCDDDYTSAGATTLTTSNQSISGTLASSACVNISCWTDYSNPTSGGVFDVYAYVYS